MADVRPGPSPAANHRHLLDPYWRANQRLIWVLLAIWALVSLGAGILFVRPLNFIQIGGLPLGFFFAQQGSIYVFIALIFVCLLISQAGKRWEAAEKSRQGGNPT